MGHRTLTTGGPVHGNPVTFTLPPTPGRSARFARGLVKRVGRPAGFHLQDLRHTGNNQAAAGASTRELMHRMGQSSMRAALIYQHATSERDREIAAGMDRRIAGENNKKAKGKRSRKKKDDGDDGAAGELARVS